MRIQVAVPEAHVDAPVLNAALESVTRLNESMLERGEIPSLERGLRYGVRWRPEPPGDEHFDSADKVLARKWGDCDDLAPWQAASLRHSGEDPGAKAIVKKSGPKRWHAVVQRSDGTIDDPSSRAGMAAGVAPGVFGASVPLMVGPSNVGGAYIVRPQIAIRPVRGAMQARADLPWHWREHLEDQPSASQWSMTALHTAPVASTALVGALTDVCRLAQAAGFADPDHIDRLCAIADACEGASFGELAEVYGHDHAEAAAAVVGSFFGKIAKGLGKVAKIATPLASKALNFVPGVGPLASMALDSGLLPNPLSMIPGGGGGGGGGAPAPSSSAPRAYAPPAQPAQHSGPRPVTPPGGAATQWGRVSPQGVDLLKALIFT